MLLYLSYLLTVFAISQAFHFQSTFAFRNRCKYLNMGIGDMLKKALANDPSLPPPKDPGLSRGPSYAMVEFSKAGVTKKIKVIQGTKISQAASDAGVEIKYSCKKGECSTCKVTVNGKPVKSCVSFIPATPTVQIIVPDKA